MRFDKLRHFLKYKLSCTDEEWDARQAVIAKLRENGYYIREAPNPCWLTVGKGEDEFIIDMWGKNSVNILPVKWVYRHTDKPVLVTDIPSSGRYGIWNEESEYYPEVTQLVKEAIEH